MKIDHIHIRNFRKLKNCRIDFDEKQTIFVGANNSGKTSAMSAIVWFLKYKDRFTTREFTLTNWVCINKIGDSWVTKDKYRNYSNLWDTLIPSLDIWISVSEEEAYKVYKIIPSLDWKKDVVGVRLRFEPKEIKTLYDDYTARFKKKEEKLKDYTRNTDNKEELTKTTNDIKLYPENLWDFLNHENNLGKYFEIKYYVLDSKNLREDGDVQYTPQNALDENPLSELVKIDAIEAYREFTDPEGKNDNDIDTLSKQLQKYYKDNFDDDDGLFENDLSLIRDLNKANETFDKKLNRSFEVPIAELARINYPGFQNPNIRVKSVIKIVDSITHDSSVQFAIQGKEHLSLPEKYNGLGLRNLISMYLKLVQFREQWTHPKGNDTQQKTLIEPIHLVLIEEPEAHLHAQAQQVFIRRALEALSDNDVLKDNNELNTQLVITTHSNHIVNEVDMNCLRYFQRIFDDKIEIPVSKVVNLSRTFGKDENDTRYFVSRYIRLTHCDIFFADAIVLVEGAAERILMPEFIKNAGLNSYYISIIEVNGSHAHRFSNLIDKLSIPTLIVTDIDTQEQSDGEWKPALPGKGKKQKTNNDTIKHWLEMEAPNAWISNDDAVDKLLDMKFKDKQKNNVQIAYQTAIQVKWDDKQDTVQCVYPYTFEDSLVFSNMQLFDKKEKGKGAVTTFYNYKTKSENLNDFHQKIFQKLKSESGIKADFANTLLLDEDFDKINTPEYIKEGLIWLKGQLDSKNGNKDGK